MLQSSTPRWRMSNFHPCTSCMRKLPLQDKHTLYVKCLSTELASDALADRSSCPICARSKEKTLESRMVHYSGEPRRAVIGLGIPGLPSPPFKPYAKYSLCTGSTALQQSLKICLEGQKESEKHGPGKGHRRVKGLNGPDTRALKQAAGTPAPAPAPPAPAPQHTPASPVITAEVQQQDLVMIEEEQDALSIAASRDEESFLQAESQDLDLTQTSADFDPQPFLVFPDFLEEVKSSWQHPASAPSVSKSTDACLHGRSRGGRARTVPSSGRHHSGLSASPLVGGLSKDPVCPNSQCRITEAHLKKAYVAEAQVMCLANTGGLLTAYLSGMLHSITLPETLASELHTVSSTLLQILGF
ncbi:UNVERIFIED_CONTAM: hypothetical protein FKN15_053402 [Acipenser sinensis]